MGMATIAIDDGFEPPPKVVNAEHMEDKDFIRHFNKRHRHQLGGLHAILPSVDEETIEMYREFHDKIHQWHLASQLEHPHEHGE